MSRALNDLTIACKAKVINLLARLDEAAIPCMIIQTLRTPSEQVVALATGHSWIQHSKHLDGNAIDICPYSEYKLHGDDKLDWNSDDPIWQRIGAIGESVGLKWGGRWKQRDVGHFELPDDEIVKV